MSVIQKKVSLSLKELPEQFAVIVKDEIHSTQVQEWMFKMMDARWRGIDKIVQHTNREVLYVEMFGGTRYLTYSTRDYFDRTAHRHYPIIDFNPMTMFEISKTVDLIEIHGNSYDRDAINKLIVANGLKPFSLE